MAHRIISTNKARCRDCYRCVRVCPAKAIRIADGQAQVDNERCIACGMCVRECPQEAKVVRDDLQMVKGLFIGAGPVIASVAPSYVAAFQDIGPANLVGRLKKLGFDMVTETAVGAEMVARWSAEMISNPEHSFISSACPSLVDYINKYHPWASSLITPVASPMVAHARYLKQKYGPDTRVVFIGPCPAKKAEGETSEGAVDAVLTFEELREWMGSAGWLMENAAPAEMDDLPAARARLFPLEGGLASSAAKPSDMLMPDFIAVSGPTEIDEMLGSVATREKPLFVEGLFCAGGCINGACFGKGKSFFERRDALLNYEGRASHRSDDTQLRDAMVGVTGEVEVKPNPIETTQFSEAQIAQVLDRIGKKTAEDELNCGACGYASCRDNALAVLSGMAEDTMCIPWMRKVAERKADRIIDASPNGIVIVNSQMEIVEFNSAFAKLFACTPALVGKPLSILMDPADFEKVLASANEQILNKHVSFQSYGFKGVLSVYKLDDGSQVVGVLSDINTGVEQSGRLEQIRQETLESAEQVIQKQMLMAQEIASILGETTSETRVLLRKLIALTREENQEPRK